MTTPLENPDKLMVDLAALGAVDLEALLQVHLKDNREILSRAGMQLPDLAGASNSLEVIHRLAVMAQAFVRSGGPSVTPRVRGAADMLAAVAAVWGTQQMRLQGRQGADQAARETMAGIYLGMATVFLRHEERGVYGDHRKFLETSRAQSTAWILRENTVVVATRRETNRRDWSAYTGKLTRTQWSKKRAAALSEELPDGETVAYETVLRDIRGVEPASKKV